MNEQHDPWATLADRRREVRSRIAALQADVAALVAASDNSNADDEHDPEGATVAFEREQLNAVLSAARSALNDVEEALARVEGGIYGRCLECGQPISVERLHARPYAARCIECARR